MFGLSTSRLARYGAAFVSTLVALLLSLLLQSVIHQIPFIFFFGAVALSAGYGGFGPGVLATVLSVALADYYLLPPYGAISYGAQSLFFLALFAGISLLISTLYARNKRAAAKADEQRKALQITLASIGDAVITTDTKATVTFLNPQAEALTGWRSAEALNQDIQKVFRVVNEETRQAATNPIFKVLQGEKKVGLANHTLLLAKDGAEHPIDDSAAPILDAEGNIAGTVLVFRDIHERRQVEVAQQLLNQQMQQAKLVAERSADRLARTQAITAALADALLPIQVAKTIVDQTIIAIDGAYGSLVALSDEKERKLNVVYSVGYSAEAERQWQNMSLDANLPMPDMVRHGEPIFLETPEEWATHYPQLSPWVTSQSLALLPLLVEGKAIGGMVVSFNARQPFGAEDRAFLNNLSRKCAQALHRAQLYAAEKQEREQVDTILNSISDAFFSFDTALNCIYVNRQGESLVERPRDQLINHRIQDIFPIVDDEPFYAGAKRALTEGTVIETEAYSPNLKRWTATRFYPYNGGLTVYIQDVSARKKAEAESQQSQMRLKQFMESDVIGITYVTSDGRVTDANDRFLQTIGYTRDELLAGKINWIAITPPEFLPLDQKAVLEGEQTGRYTPFEKVYIHKDGHPVPVLIGGALVEGTFISYVMDLTERKRAEQQLRLLTEASAILASSLDYETTLKSVAQIVVPALADWCSVHLVDEEGTVQQVALAHKDPAKVAWAYELQERYPPDPGAPTGLYEVIRTGKAELYPHFTEEMLVAAAKNDEQLHLIHDIGFSAAIIVPLKIQERTIGALQLVSAEGKQHYTADDLVLAEDMARRAALAVENARLYRAIHQERERLQVTLSSIGDAVIATDDSGRITFINPVGEALTGWTLADALDKDLSEIFHIVNATTRETVESPVVKVLREGVVAGLANHTLLIAKDGTEVPIDDSGAPIRDTNGDLMGVILVFRDIRQRREAEIQLETTLQRTYDLYATSRQIGVAHTPKGILSALLTSRYIENAAQAAIVVFDKAWQDDPATYEVEAALSDSTLPGFAADHSLRDSPLARLFSSNQSLFLDNVSDDARLDPATKALLAEQKIAQLMFFPLWAAGGCFGLLALYCAATNLCTEDDFRHIRIFADQVAIVMDNVRLLDAERQARREAEYANELKLKFLAMISHELRTPLTSIKGFVTSLLATDVTWSEEDQREFITIISEESDKLTDLISQLLDLSQLQAGTLRIQPSTQTVQSIFDIATVQLNTLAERHRLTIHISPDLPPITADAQRIAEVVTNLVGNAVKYAPEGTPIRVEASRQDGMITVSVSDEGPGIPPENRDVVFEAFRQLERKSAQPLKGAGLGLAICKGLIEAHHGRIWISNETHTGTTIIFALPLATPQPA